MANVPETESEAERRLLFARVTEPASLRTLTELVTFYLKQRRTAEAASVIDAADTSLASHLGVGILRATVFNMRREWPEAMEHWQAL